MIDDNENARLIDFGVAYSTDAGMPESPDENISIGLPVCT